MSHGRWIGAALFLGLLMSSTAFAQGRPGGPPPPKQDGQGRTDGDCPKKGERPAPDAKSPPPKGDGGTTGGGDSSTGTGGGKGNNGVGNGEDPQPPGDPPVNDGDGTGKGNPGNKGKKK